jgi:hypothetical protein
MRPAIRALPIILLLFLLATGGLAGFWFHEEKLVRGGLADWTEARRAEGYKIDYAAPAISGFPFTVAIRLDRPTVTDPSGRWQWTGEAIEAVSHIWSIADVVIHPLGRQVLAYPAGDKLASIAATAASAEGTLSFDIAGRPHALHMTADKLALELLPGDPRLNLTASGAQLDLTLPEHSDAKAAAGASPNLPPSLELETRLDDLTLPQAIDTGPLGDKIHWLTARAELEGTVPAGTPAKALAAWRDQGGTLELKSLDIDWGPLRMAVNGTLALDDTMQPEGAGTAKLQGYGETIDVLVARGLVKPNDGAFVKAALNLMARTPPEGGEKMLSLSLHVQKQALYAGPLKLMRLPPIKWAE